MFDKVCLFGHSYVGVNSELRKLRHFNEDGIRTSHIVTRFVPGHIVFDKVCVSGHRYVAV